MQMYYDLLFNRIEVLERNHNHTCLIHYSTCFSNTLKGQHNGSTREYSSRTKIRTIGFIIHRYS